MTRATEGKSLEPRQEIETEHARLTSLLDELGGTLGAADQKEQLAGYGEVDVAELLSIADQLDNLPDAYSVEFDESWREWGTFRAVVHRVVWRAVTMEH